MASAHHGQQTNCRPDLRVEAQHLAQAFPEIRPQFLGYTVQGIRQLKYLSFRCFSVVGLHFLNLSHE